MGRELSLLEDQDSREVIEIAVEVAASPTHDYRRLQARLKVEDRMMGAVRNFVLGQVGGSSCLAEVVQSAAACLEVEAQSAAAVAEVAVRTVAAYLQAVAHIESDL